MALIKISSNEKAPLQELYRLVLRYLYEPQKMTAAEITHMHNSIRLWDDHFLDLFQKKQDRFRIHLLKEDRLEESPEFGFFCKFQEWVIQKDTNTLPGTMKRSIQWAKLGMFDWRKRWKLPEAYTAEGLHKAQENYKEYKKKNPEQEDDGTGR